jgi:hypothetical protein
VSARKYILPTYLPTLRLWAKQGIFAAHIGEAGQICSANNKFSRIFFCCASPIGGVQITGLIVLAKLKRNERIGEAQTTIRSASHIVIEIAY